MVSTPQIIGQSPAPAEPLAQTAVPAPAPLAPAAGDSGKPARPALDPTRYGDWEKNGRCIDF